MTTMRASRVARALEWLATETDHDTPDREPIAMLGRGRAIVELLLEELGVDAPMTPSREYVAAASEAPAERPPETRPGTPANTIDSLLGGRG